jgi:hypothetical protein
MATRKVIKGVLGNFLGTYISRYSDYNGYWLFAFLVGDFEALRINLLGQCVDDPSSPEGLAITSAVAKFEDQRRKANLAKFQIHEALLTIRQSPELVSGQANGHSRV